MTLTDQLPDKPSDLIKVALVDLKSIRRSQKYIVNMQRWHEPIGDACHVCLAGAVMARSLGANPHGDLTPGDYGGMISKKLDALDDFRSGAVSVGFDSLGLGYEHGEAFDRFVPGFNRNDPRPFYKAMEKLADDLRAAGY